MSNYSETYDPTLTSWVESEVVDISSDISKEKRENWFLASSIADYMVLQLPKGSSLHPGNSSKWSRETFAGTEHFVDDQGHGFEAGNKEEGPLPIRI